MNFEKGFEILGGKLDYNRLDVLQFINSSLKWELLKLKFLEEFLREAPIWKNFEIIGDPQHFFYKSFSKINTPSTFSFVTMPSGSFYVDQFAALHFSQGIAFSFKTSK